MIAQRIGNREMIELLNPIDCEQAIVNCPINTPECLFSFSGVCSETRVPGLGVG